MTWISRIFNCLETSNESSCVKILMELTKSFEYFCPTRYHLFRFKHTHEGDFLESTGIFQFWWESPWKYWFSSSLVATKCINSILILFLSVFILSDNFSPVFIYSMPGYSVSIKERMLYSSCKNSVVEAIQKVPDTSVLYFTGFTKYKFDLTCIFTTLSSCTALR